MSDSQPPPPYSASQDPNAVPPTSVPQAYPQDIYPKQPGQGAGPPPPPAYGPGAYQAQSGQGAGPPPPPAYGPGAYQAQSGQPGMSTSMVVTQPSLIVGQPYRETPVRMICSFCHSDIVTSTSYETGMLTWVACGAVCLIGFNLGCCFIPFFLDACKDCVHTCPSCHHQLGRWNRI